MPDTPGCRTTTVPTRDDPARDALFRNLLDNPPFPAGSSLEAQRDILDALQSINPDLPADAAVRQVTLATGARAELVTPPEAHDARAILYTHGGAFVNGRSAGVWQYPVYRIAATAGAKLLHVLHRLAPEHPFPAARDDVLAAYDHLLRTGYDPEQIVFVADSAGVNIALTALLALRARGAPMPAGLVSIGGWIDLTDRDESSQEGPLDPLAIPAQLNAAARAYLGHTDARSAAANPLHADLHGLPPTLLLVGGSELLKADALRFSDRACRARVEVHVEVWEGLLHGWYLFANGVADAEATYRRVGDEVRQRCLSRAEPGARARQRDRASRAPR
ncbi:putative hydrolase [Gemmatirosa kalamazoonensis]|uniref:Putative hydrolase n=1 Tax=Gemmatirosa kalamazoonensis TaxID=861299 RepID=W0RJX6_9BACT|nr:alpha/beta hydrolase fold domain-containing protein [Gemmatirosa kalamazoonensis]AHG89693.1 putative hydrolase [Gemmatirosa kalamazoonensis]